MNAHSTTNRVRGKVPGAAVGVFFAKAHDLSPAIVARDQFFGDPIAQSARPADFIDRSAEFEEPFDVARPQGGETSAGFG